MILDTFSLFITMEWPLLSFFSYISYPEHSTDTQTVHVFHSLIVSVICGTKYSRMDQVKFAEDSLQRNFNLKKF